MFGWTLGSVRVKETAEFKNSFAKMLLSTDAPRSILYACFEPKPLSINGGVPNGIVLKFP